MATARYNRRKVRRERDTFSFYLLPSVIAAVDALVESGRYANRSDAVEDACRLLVLQASLDRLSTDPERAA